MNLLFWMMFVLSSRFFVLIDIRGMKNDPQHIHILFCMDMYGAAVLGSGGKDASGTDAVILFVRFAGFGEAVFHADGSCIGVFALQQDQALLFVNGQMDRTSALFLNAQIRDRKSVV